MKIVDFTNNVVNPRLEQCQRLLSELKNKEYNNDDKFYCFKRVAQIRNVHVIEAWDGMQSKHLMSFFDMINDAKAGKFISEKLINNEITKIINYILMFEGLVKEQQTQKEHMDDPTDETRY